jgi:DNA-binding MarR family transcriptional regulator
LGFSLSSSGSWLNANEQHAWRLFLQFQRTFAERLSADMAEHGVDFSDYEVLALLSEAPEQQLRMFELAAMVVSAPSRLTYRIDQLVRRGLVERIACDTDRRGSFAHLTQAGLDLVLTAAPVHVAGVRRYLFDLLAPDELAAMIGMLARSLPLLRADEAGEDKSDAARIGE